MFGRVRLIEIVQSFMMKTKIVLILKSLYKCSENLLTHSVVSINTVLDCSFSSSFKLLRVEIRIHDK